LDESLAEKLPNLIIYIAAPVSGQGLPPGRTAPIRPEAWPFERHDPNLAAAFLPPSTAFELDPSLLSSVA
jgi:hypothetical protein